MKMSGQFLWLLLGRQGELCQCHPCSVDHSKVAELHHCPPKRLFPDVVFQGSHGERENKAFKMLLD